MAKVTRERDKVVPTSMTFSEPLNPDIKTSYFLTLNILNTALFST